MFGAIIVIEWSFLSLLRPAWWPRCHGPEAGALGIKYCMDIDGKINIIIVIYCSFVWCIEIRYHLVKQCAGQNLYSHNCSCHHNSDSKCSLHAIGGKWRRRYPALSNTGKSWRYITYRISHIVSRQHIINPLQIGRNLELRDLRYTVQAAFHCHIRLMLCHSNCTSLFHSYLHVYFLCGTNASKSARSLASASISLMMGERYA